MKRILSIMCLMTFIGLSGCTAPELGDRNRELKNYEGKTIKEAHLRNDDTIVVRFDDGEMLVIEKGENCVWVNGQND